MWPQQPHYLPFCQQNWLQHYYPCAMPAPPAPWAAEGSCSSNSDSETSRSDSSSTDNEPPKSHEKAEEVHEEPCAAAVPIPIVAPASMSTAEASHAGDRRGGSDPGAAWWNDRSNRGANRGANREARTANAAPWRPATNAATRQHDRRDQRPEDHRENYAGRSIRVSGFTWRVGAAERVNSMSWCCCSCCS